MARPPFPCSCRENRSPWTNVSERFAHYRDELGLPRELTPHGLRHTYVTHLIEDGFDPLFVQMQVGHRHASSTAIYTAVNGDFKQRALADALRSQLELGA